MDPGHLILAIETSNPSAGDEGAPAAGVAIVRSEADGSMRTLGVEWLRPTGRHDDDLMPAIERLFARTGVVSRDIQRVAVSIGPGGYTGLRVAVTTANVIAETCGAEAVGVPTALALNLRAGVPQPLAVCLAVKGSSVWVHRFPCDRAGVERVGALAGSGLRGLIADRFLPDEVRSALEGEGVAIERPTYDPVAVGEIARDLPGSGVIRALYAREPEAVTRWRERHGPPCSGPESR